MAGRTATKTQASRAALMGQIATVVVAAGAVAAIMLWPKESGKDATAVSWGEIQQQADLRYQESLKKSSTEGAGELSKIDVRSAASFLAIAGRVELPKAVNEDLTTETSGGETSVEPLTTLDPEDDVSEGLTKYLGLVSAGSRRFGLFRIGEPQGIIAEGEKRSFAPRGRGRGDDPVEVEVVSVSKDQAVVIEDGVRRTVDKEARSSSQVTQVTAPPPGRTTDRKPPQQEASSLKRPSIQDFQKEDGTYDRAAYAQALRDYNRERAGIARESSLRSQGGARGARLLGGDDGDAKRSTE